MIRYFLILLSFSCLAAGQLQAPVNQNCSSTNVKPNASVGKYYVYTTNTTKPCLVAHITAYINLSQGQYLKLDNGSVNTTTSFCGSANANPVLDVDFIECGHNLRIEIDRNGTKTYIKSITGYYKLPNETQPIRFINATEEFVTTQSGHYYKCNAEQSIGLTIFNASVPHLPMAASVSLVLSNLAYEAYRDVSGTDFYGVPEECPLDAQPVSDLVRVAVGICLVALVAIVLVAYFVGRRRWSERSTYESV